MRFRRISARVGLLCIRPPSRPSPPSKCTPFLRSAGNLKRSLSPFPYSLGRHRVLFDRQAQRMRKPFSLDAVRWRWPFFKWACVICSQILKFPGRRSPALVRKGRFPCPLHTLSPPRIESVLRVGFRNVSSSHCSPPPFRRNKPSRCDRDVTDGSFRFSCLTLRSFFSF